MRQSKPSSGRSKPRTRRKRLVERRSRGQAKAQFDKAQKAMQQGDWETFGKAMEALKRLLTGPTQ